MTTILLLAGGKSTRMGQDKAMMNGGAKRLLNIYSSLGVERVITLCGDESRIDLFEGEVWPDPQKISGPLELIKWCLTQIKDDIQLVPCDAFNLLEAGAEWLLIQKNGVPIDENMQRQPLLARITNRELLDIKATTLNGLLANFPSLEKDNSSSQFSNFNTKAELN
ncbi:MAG: NTP transferase domain-containing protein [Candidatus Poseidoniaceae archaeon]|nr:NTP transferase domain-containing protein [Candidatus Poseidoniaceae archaeon]